jgi:UDP-N-acetylmuramate dehydrogenase
MGVTNLDQVGLHLVSTAVRAVRERKDHLESETCASAGSFFKNYEMDPESPQFEDIVRQFERRKETLRDLGHNWVDSKWTARRRGTPELIANSLIATSSTDSSDPEEFRPGRVHGRLRLGRSGPNTIVNLGGATAEDVLDLARRMRAAVESAYGVTLESEVVFLGRLSL